MYKNFKLQIFFLILTISSFIALLLIESNVFNLSQSTQLIVVSIITIFLLSLLIVTSISDSISILIVSNFSLFYVLLVSPTIIKPSFFQHEFKLLKVYLVFFILIITVFFINISIITMRLNSINKPTLTQITNKKVKHNIFFIYLNKLDHLLNSILYKIRILFPIIAYVIAISVTILIFAMIYDSNSLYSKDTNLNEGLFYSQQVDENNNRIRAEEFEQLYFSTCIFLNTNDGNIQPIGNTIKLLVQLEMLLAHIINIIFIPTLLFFYLKIFETQPTISYNKSKRYPRYSYRGKRSNTRRN